MITPLDIENKKFSKKALSGYNTEEVDDFLDELTIDYEKIYKEASESKNTIENLNAEIEKYRQMETTLQSTLLMAQNAAEEVKNSAKEQASMIINEAQRSVEGQITDLDSSISAKRRELEDLKAQIESYKSRMESLLLAQLDLLRKGSI